MFGTLASGDARRSESVSRMVLERFSTVFTVDYSDFETYRIDGRRRFRVLPVRQP